MFLATRAKTSFDNFKKNYTKKRSNFRNSKKSGTSREAVEKAEREFNQLSFMVWLDDFIRPRNSKSSFDDGNDSECQNNFGNYTLNDDDEDYVREAETQQEDDSYVMSPAVTNDDSANVSAARPTRNIQQAVKCIQPLKRKHAETKETEMEKEKLSFLKTINQRMETRDRKQKCEDPEDVATIADKLRELPYRERLMAKHDMENILFKYQMQVLEKRNANTMQVNSAENRNLDLSVHQFSVTGSSPQVHYNWHQQNVPENIPTNQSNNCLIINHTNQSLSPTFSTTPTPSPSYPFNVPQNGERNNTNIF